MRPIRIDSRIQEALAFVLLRFCWRLGFLDFSNVAPGSSEGTNLKKVQVTELTEDAQTAGETSTNFEANRESLEGISRIDPKDDSRLKDTFSPFNNCTLKLGAA